MIINAINYSTMKYQDYIITIPDSHRCKDFLLHFKKEVMVKKLSVFVGFLNSLPRGSNTVF